MAKEVLIVEDDRALAKSLARVLEQAGFTTRVTHDGVDALQAVARAAPDLVLLDLLIPKKDGQAVLVALRESPVTRSIPVVVMTGVLRGKNHERVLLKGGARGFLEKPFTGKQLADEILGLIGQPDADDPEQQAVRRSLSEYTVSEILWHAMQRGLTGAVHFERGKLRKALVLHEGRPVAVRSNLARECLGKRLAEAGRIDQQALDESVRRAKAHGVPQGESLVQLGVISKAEIGAALRDQAEEKLLELFTWSEGTVWEQEGVREVAMSTELAGWTPREVLLHGVMRMDPARVRRLLEPFLKHSVAAHAEGLGPREQPEPVRALLAAVGPEMSVADLVEAHTLALYATWRVGVLQFLPTGEDADEDETGTATSVHVEATLRALAGRQEEQTHFEVLGLSPDAAPGEIRKAFVGLAKHYHPDRFAGQPDRVRAYASRIFARISQAHEVLSDSGQRAAYRARLQSGQSEAQEREQVQRIVTAEQHYQRAEGLVRQRAYAEARTELERALELDPEEGEFHALYGWAHFLTEGGSPSARDVAAEHMVKATSLAPRSASGYYYQGLLWKACGEAARAETMFREALEHQPKHVESARELRLLEQRKRKR